MTVELALDAQVNLKQKGVSITWSGRGLAHAPEAQVNVFAPLL